MGMNIIFIASLVMGMIAGASVYSRGITFNNSKEVKKTSKRISIVFGVIIFFMTALILNSINDNLDKNKMNDVTNVIVNNNKEKVETLDYCGNIESMNYTERGLEIKLSGNTETTFIITDNTKLDEKVQLSDGNTIVVVYEKSENTNYIYVKRVKHYVTEIAA